ncbi:hypothetical protein NP493_2979g00007 [Ridgeia piscesae]|uniref:Uncharacterized protein n=1 Tax=Ridgeia piscesae TaxID=27915 RepID=A0AAD9JB46_RIDPI|nr:hypothetical protein NP493_2979g00007 [Ridgeia piscesae]
MHTKFYIVRDFNLHLDTPSATTTTFNDILASLDTKQHVNFLTHTHDHWLDSLFKIHILSQSITPAASF